MKLFLAVPGPSLTICKLGLFFAATACSGKFCRAWLYSGGAALLLVFGLGGTTVQATNYWKNSVATGSWSAGSNWSATSAVGADNAGAPTASEAVNIVLTDGMSHTVTYDVAAPAIGLLSIDLTGPGTTTSTLLLTGNDLVTNGIVVGGYTGAAFTSGRGAVIQSAGTVTTTPVVSDLILGFGTSGTSGSGTYTLSGGSFVNNLHEYIGYSGTGTFNHSGGTNTVNANATGFFSVGHNAGSAGTYNLSGSGALSVTAHEYIGHNGTGTFNQSGGTNTISGNHNLYLAFNSSTSVGTYTVSGNSILTVGNNLIVGQNGTGTLNIQGASSVYVQNDIITNNQSNINLNGGTLRFNTLNYVGSTRLHFNSGTVRLAGARTFGSDSTISQILDEFNTLSPGKTLTIEGGAGSVGTIFNQDTNAFHVRGGTFNSLKDVQVGSDADGLLRVTSGGTFVSPNSQIGVDTGSGNGYGTVILDGAGSIWKNSGNLVVGSATAPAELSVSNGATLDTGGLVIYPKGRVHLSGGTIRFNSYGRVDEGTFEFSYGTIEMQGDHRTGFGFAIPDLFGFLPTVPASKNLTIEGVTTIDTSITITGGTFKTGSIIVSSGGLLNFQSGVLELTGGVITGLTQLNVPTSGEFRASGSQSLRVAGAAGSMITATGNLTLGNAAAVNGFGTQGTLQVGANSVTLLDANDVVFDSLALATLGDAGNSGTLNAANGLTLNFGGNLTGFGTVSTPNNTAKPLINNGHITGGSVAQPITIAGYVKGVGTFDNVNFTGTFSPGLSTTISTASNVALSPTSTLIMEIGGTVPGSGHDQLQSSAALAFDGILQVSLIDGFSPTAGQSFNLFDWVSTSGTFATINLPTLAGLAWNINQLYTTGVVSVGLAGDYNSNGTVDAADYIIWRKDPNYTLAQYEVWRAHFGQLPGSGSDTSVSAAVPEPMTLVLILVGTLALLAQRRFTAS